MLKPDGSLAAKVCIETINDPRDVSKKLVRLAYIALRDDCGFNELIPIDDPQTPTEVYNYNLLTPSEKDKFCAKFPDFWRDGIGGRYLHGINYARETTRRNFQWLLEMRDVFQAREDISAVKKVNDRLAMFDVEEVAQVESLMSCRG